MRRRFVNSFGIHTWGSRCMHGRGTSCWHSAFRHVCVGNHSQVRQFLRHGWHCRRGGPQGTPPGGVGGGTGEGCCCDVTVLRLGGGRGPQGAPPGVREGGLRLSDGAGGRGGVISPPWSRPRFKHLNHLPYPAMLDATQTLTSTTLLPH